MKPGRIRVPAVFLLVLIIVFSCFTPAFALGGRYVKVSKTGQAMESITVNGITVNAVYKAGTDYEDLMEDPTYSCAAFVKRFYSQVYGLYVYNFYEEATPRASGVTFVETDTPQVGDIVRDNKKIHWAVVKAVNGNTITIAHQNYSYTSGGVTYAKVGCTLSAKDSRYTFFTCNISQPPKTPTGISVTPGEHQNTVTWDKVSCTGYVVECKNEDGKFVEVGKVNTNSFVHEGLTTGQTYEYRVRAYRNGGSKVLYSDKYTSVAEGTPIVILPATVQNVVAVGGEKRISLTWDKIDNADGYYVYLYKEGEEPTLLKECTEAETIVYELQNETTYSFVVKAYRFVDDAVHTGEEYSVVVSATPSVERPGAPTIITVCSENRIQISFGNQINYRKFGTISGYYLYRFDVAENNFVLIQTLDKNAVHCFDSGLEVGSNYHYKLTSFKISDGVAYESDAVYFSEYFRAYQPLLPTEAKAEVGLFVTTLSWVTNGPTAGFEIYKLDDVTGNWTYLGESQSESFTVWNSHNSVSYKIVPYSLYNEIRYYNQTSEGIIVASLGM